MAAADQRYLDIGSLKIDDEIDTPANVSLISAMILAFFVEKLKHIFLQELLKKNLQFL